MLSTEAVVTRKRAPLVNLDCLLERVTNRTKMITCVEMNESTTKEVDCCQQNLSPDTAHVDNINGKDIGGKIINVNYNRATQ